MKKHILWVDDTPKNNSDERGVLETQGYEFTLAVSTNDALEKLAHQTFAAIISDMRRKEGAREGYVLLDCLRSRSIQIPFIIYAGSSLEVHRLEVLHHGGQGTTSSAVELLDMLNDATKDTMLPANTKIDCKSC